MSLENVYYVYQIVDPRSDLIIYVGKGKDQRYLVHQKRVLQGKKDINPKLANKLRKIFDEGFQPGYVFVQKDMSEDDAYALEQKITVEIGLDNLCNLKYGGTNGAKFTSDVRAKMSHSAQLKDKSVYADPERRRRISESRTGLVVSEVTRKKLSDQLVGKSFIERFGSERAAEIGKRISEANSGQKRPKQSIAMKGRFSGENHPMYGRKMSDQFKEDRRQYMLSDSNPGKHKTEETKRKISASQSGRPGRKHTEEHKKMMAEVMRKVWEKRRNANK